MTKVSISIHIMPILLYRNAHTRLSINIFYINPNFSLILHDFLISSDTGTECAQIPIAHLITIIILFIKN